ncbi:MAG TPA: polysulfide reductase [Bacteroidales bacterium]|nr:polysulfide reductase [Bacteroidales bacterium]
MSATLTNDESKTTFNRIATDLIRPLTRHAYLETWLLTLALAIAVSVYAYYLQFTKGLGVTGLHDYVSWGMYLSNFVFFVASSLVGMLISSVLGLANQKWIIPISRIAEFIALAFALWAGLVIVIDMGRPDRLLNVFIHGRIQSPIVWDITVITTYVAISTLLVILPLIPDIAILRKRMTDAPAWQQTMYKVLSLGWVGLPEQYKLLHRSIRTLLILIVPVAFAIHTVTSWLFAATLRPGWDSTIFGPYFISGAFVAGVAAVLIAMYFFRTNYKLKDYITDMHFDKMGKLLVLVSLVYFYFNINEFLVPYYKMRQADAVHLNTLFTGHYAPMFWSVQIFGLILPIILLLFPKMRKPGAIATIAVFVLVGSWFKRLLIVVPTMLHPHLPIQNVPESFHVYVPTGLEIVLTLFPMVGVLLVITILAKLFPVIPIWEYAHDKGVSEEHINE